MGNYSYINSLKNYPNSLLYVINRAGRGRVDSEFYIKRDSTYPYCVIHYVIDGSGFVSVGGKISEISRGKLFILKPYQAHEYWSSKDETLNFNWIEFSGGDCIKLLENIMENLDVVLDTPYSTNLNENIIEIISALGDDKEVDELDLSIKLYKVLLELFLLAKNAQFQSTEVSTKTSMNKVIGYIEGNLGDELTIEILANIANFNATYFAKIFKEIFGITPAKYVTDKRIKKACEMLIATQKTIEQIAESCGFCSSSHFIRVFKGIEGQTPSEYRRHSLLYGLDKTY